VAHGRQQHLDPAPEADRREMVRRVYFDLHGLPPTNEQLNEFVSSADSRAYENLIDELLASPRYGERWAQHWLDLVRYAESDGYNQDAYRPAAWPYRDWVIKALNADMVRKAPPSAMMAEPTTTKSPASRSCLPGTTRMDNPRLYPSARYIRAESTFILHRYFPRCLD
jgi:hypothetical protein